MLLVKVTRRLQHLARSTEMGLRTLRRLPRRIPSDNPTHSDPAFGTSPPPTRYTPSTHNPLYSWDRGFASATAPHDARHAPPRCWSARHHRRTRTKTSTPPDAAVRGMFPPSCHSRRPLPALTRHGGALEIL